MLRGSRILKSRPRSEAISHLPRFAFPEFVLFLESYLARFDGRAPPNCTLTWELFRTIRGSRTLNLCTHFESLWRSPMVAYSHFVLSPQRYSACSEGRAPSISTHTLELFRMLHGVAYPQFVLSLSSCVVYSEGRVPSICARTLKLFVILG